MKFSGFFGRTSEKSAAKAQLAAARLAWNRAGDPRLKAALQLDIDELSAEVAFDELTCRDAQRPAIAEARDQLRKLGAMLAGRPDAAVGTGVAIGIAIQYGAPIYNKGSHIGCACLYDYAARLILRTLESAAGQPAPVPAIRKRFASVSFEPITPMSANRRAWELRQAFDEVLIILTNAAAAAAAPPKAESPRPAPGKMVFVCHATPDKAPAERLVQSLEEAGIHCWIAPRDVPMGKNYSEAIVEAITTTHVTLLILSSQANSSTFIPNEIERANNYGKQIVTARLENVMPSRGFELFVGPRHWIDLFDNDPQREENHRRLVERLREICGVRTGATGV